MFLGNTSKGFVHRQLKILLLLVVSTLILVYYYNILTTADERPETFPQMAVRLSTRRNYVSVWKRFTEPRSPKKKIGLVSIPTRTTIEQYVSKSLKGIPDRPKFQKVNNHVAWLFSAFFDNFNNTDLIRVFGIQPFQLRTPVYCHLREGSNTYIVEGTKIHLLDGFPTRIKVFSYVCPLNKTSRPNNVSLTFENTDTPTNSLLVLYPQALQRNFTVCYAMLYNYTNPYQLIQNVEFNRVLGAEHFFLYRKSVSSAVDTVLRHYQIQGFMTVIDWPIPVWDIAYHGQKLIINDCVYRNRGVSRYVAIQDTDEFIIPHQHDSWSELINALNKEFELSNKTLGEKLGTYIVQSTFYQHPLNSSEWETIKQNFSVSEENFQMFKKFSITVFSNLKRLKTHFVGERQKSIVRPETVLFNDVHTPGRNRPGIANVTVSVDLALVHHHREWTSPQDNIIDATSLKFKDRVLPLINETLSHLFFVKQV